MLSIYFVSMYSAQIKKSSDAIFLEFLYTIKTIATAERNALCVIIKEFLLVKFYLIFI